MTQDTQDVLRHIAALTVRARAQVRGSRLPPGVGEALLCDLEHALASLIVLGAVPPPRAALSPRDDDAYWDSE